MSLEVMARLWFERSPLQHAVLVKNLIRLTRGEMKK